LQREIIEMNQLFEIIFMEEAFDFLKELDRKHYEKIIYNIRKSQMEQDAELFKKLEDEIWEFRTLFQKTKYRLFAFWDNTDSEKTIVVSTHGIIKKTDKIPKKEILKAKQLRLKYFDEKIKRKNK
jgi:phage-related protein